MSWQKVCGISDVGEDELEEIKVGEITVLVANSGGEFYVYPPFCPHQETSLSLGMIDDGVLTCIKHLWQWDMKTGEVRDNAESPLKLYEVMVENGDVFVNLDKELKYEY